MRSGNQVEIRFVQFDTIIRRLLGREKTIQIISIYFYRQRQQSLCNYIGIQSVSKLIGTPTVCALLVFSASSSPGPCGIAYFPRVTASKEKGSGNENAA